MPFDAAPTTPDDAAREAMRWAERLVTHLDRYDGDTDALVCELATLTARIKEALAYAHTILPTEPRIMVGLPGGVGLVPHRSARA